MREATVEHKEDLVVNKVADTMTVARLATPAVASATWQRTAVKVKNATTVVVWDTSAATATKLLKPKFATDANNPGTSPVTVPTNPSRQPKF